MPFYNAVNVAMVMKIS